MYLEWRYLNPSILVSSANLLTVGLTSIAMSEPPIVETWSSLWVLRRLGILQLRIKWDFKFLSNLKIISLKYYTKWHTKYFSSHDFLLIKFWKTNFYYFKTIFEFQVYLSSLKFRQLNYNKNYNKNNWWLFLSFT